MKALINLIGEVFTEIVRASVDVVSVANVGGGKEQYTYWGGNNQ
jgi:hypothetical protein